MLNVSLNTYVAVFVDADNADLRHLDLVLKLAEYYGILEVCRAFGDWKSPPLSSHRQHMEALKIECEQVDRVGKNATDHRLLVAIGELLPSAFIGNDVSVFIIVSGDGDFASACKLIMDRGKRVIGIGSKKHTSDDLRNSCNEFYFLEDLEQLLKEQVELQPIPPGEVRDFFHHLFWAYHKCKRGDDWDWVPYTQIEAKLRDGLSDYDSRFGSYPLAVWLGNYAKDFESRDQMVRRIDPNPEVTRLHLLVEAYDQVRLQDGRAHLGQLGKALRAVAKDFEQQFGSKKVSEWLEQYPTEFKIDENYVFHKTDWR